MVRSKRRHDRERNKTVVKKSKTRHKVLHFARTHRSPWPSWWPQASLTKQCKWFDSYPATARRWHARNRSTARLDLVCRLARSSWFARKKRSGRQRIGRKKQSRRQRIGRLPSIKGNALKTTPSNCESATTPRYVPLFALKLRSKPNSSGHVSILTPHNRWGKIRPACVTENASEQSSSARRRCILACIEVWGLRLMHDLTAPGLQEAATSQCYQIKEAKGEGEGQARAMS